MNLSDLLHFLVQHGATKEDMKNVQSAVEQLQKQLTYKDDTIKHLRGKAEFDMPDEMRGRFHNGQCPDPCDMIDGPCACGATHNVKEWIGKLNKQLAVAEEREKRLRETVGKGKKLLARCVTRISFLEKRTHISTLEGDDAKQVLKDKP